MTDHARIAAAAGVDDELLVIDTRNEPVELRLYQWRAWVSGGVRCEVLRRSISEQDQPQFNGRMAGIPLAVLARYEDQQWGLFSEMLAASARGSRDVIQIVDHDGHWRVGTAPVNSAAFLDRTGSTTLTVTASNTKIFRAMDFPCDIKLRLSDPGGPQNYIEFTARSLHESDRARLPGPARVRISGRRAREGTLRVDIVPGSTRDEWSFQFLDSALEAVKVPATPSRSSDALRRTAIVFDRTCPDWDRWSEALQLAQQRHPSQSNPPNPSQSLQFNAGIRGALQLALSKYPWPAGSRCRLAWFADVPENDVAGFRGVAWPTVPWGIWGDFALPEGLGDIVDNLTYYPGLDVWDPLEEALASTKDFFHDSDSGTLIIIGNSPPSYPEDPESPLCRIASYSGFDTMWRRKSDLWDETRRELYTAGVAIFYVFLRLGARSPEQETDFFMFNALQDRVESSLKLSLPGRVLGVNATPENVAEAITNALDTARKAEFHLSDVEVLGVERARNFDRGMAASPAR
jgi:hypothetical protein